MRSSMGMAKITGCIEENGLEGSKVDSRETSHRSSLSLALVPCSISTH